MSKVIICNGGFFSGCLNGVNLKVFQRGGRKQHKHVFVLSRSLLLNRLEPQSSKVKLLLPIKPIGIVAYAFTLSSDSLCRNSCMATSVGGQDEPNRALCLATRAGRWSYLARSGLPAVSRKKNFPESHIKNPLLTKLVRSRWLDIDLVLFWRVYGSRFRLGP